MVEYMAKFVVPELQVGVQKPYRGLLIDLMTGDVWGLMCVLTEVASILAESIPAIMMLNLSAL